MEAAGDESLAEQAYMAYGKAVDYKNYLDLPMPKWDDLPEKIQQAWLAVVTEIGIELSRKI